MKIKEVNNLDFKGQLSGNCPPPRTLSWRTSHLFHIFTNHLVKTLGCYMWKISFYETHETHLKQRPHLEPDAPNSLSGHGAKIYLIFPAQLWWKWENSTMNNSPYRSQGKVLKERSHQHGWRSNSTHQTSPYRKLGARERWIPLQTSCVGILSQSVRKIARRCTSMVAPFRRQMGSDKSGWSPRFLV